MLFEFLSDQQPFSVSNGDQAELFQVIMKGKFEFNENWEGISKEAKDLVRHLLEKDPTQRYSMSEVKEHPWFQKF